MFSNKPLLVCDELVIFLLMEREQLEVPIIRWVSIPSLAIWQNLINGPLSFCKLSHFCVLSENKTLTKKPLGKCFNVWRGHKYYQQSVHSAETLQWGQQFNLKKVSLAWKHSKAWGHWYSKLVAEHQLKNIAKVIYLVFPKFSLQVLKVLSLSWLTAGLSGYSLQSRKSCSSSSFIRPSSELLLASGLLFPFFSYRVLFLSFFKCHPFMSLCPCFPHSFLLLLFLQFYPSVSFSFLILSCSRFSSAFLSSLSFLILSSSHIFFQWLLFLSFSLFFLSLF